MAKKKSGQGLFIPPKHTPLAEHLKKWMVERIARGEWKVGDKVISERELAAICKVSRMTARQAILEMTKEGWLRRHVGQGTFVAAQLPRKSATSADEMVALLSAHGPESVSAAVYFQHAAFARGFHTLFFDLSHTQQDPAKEREILEHCANRGITRIALFPTPRADMRPFYASLRRRGMKIVLFAAIPYDMSPECYCLMDHEQAGYLGAKRLLSAGYERVSFVSLYDPLNAAVVLFQSGYRRALAEHGIDWAPSYNTDINEIFPSGIANEEVLAKAFGANLAKGTAFLAPTPLRGAVVHTALRVLGKCVPEDYGIMVFDPEESALSSSFARLDGNIREVMRQCVEILCADNHAGEMAQILVPPLLVEGATVLDRVVGECIVHGS